MFILNTLSPYKQLNRQGIQYSVCRDYDHISRYRNLRQVIHCPNNASERFMATEVPNPIVQNDVQFTYHVVTPDEENRLDVISYKHLGTASYAWTIAYFNHIEDGYTVKPGQTVKVPRSVTDLMTTGNILQSVTALQLNLGSEQ